MVLGNFQCRGIILIRKVVGQRPTLRSVGAGGGCLVIFFSRLSFLFLSTEILPRRTVQPKTTNQPTRFEIFHAKVVVWRWWYKLAM